MKYIRFFLFIILVIPIQCMASTNTFNRTNENLLLPDDVVVDEKMMADVLKTPAIDSKEKIYDFAELYTPEEEEKIFKHITSYIKSTKMDAVLVTTRELNGLELSDFAYHFYDYNDFKDDGIIFVIYMGEAEPRIFMGNGGKASSIYTDARINQTLAYVYKNISAKNYYQATEDFYKIVDGFYNIDKKSDGEYRVGQDGKMVLVIPWVEMFILAGSLTFLIMFIIISRMKKNNKKVLVDMLDTHLDSDSLYVKTKYENPVTSKGSK